MEPRTLFPGIGEAVARRTILRPFDAPTESWADVAERVATGNAALHPSGERDREAMIHHTSAMTMLWSGRHLQHGDASQPERPQSVFSNCATSPTSFMLFAYLLAGSGVGTAYDDALKVVDWTQMPSIRFVLQASHPDYAEAVRDLGFEPHECASMTDANLIVVPDSREGWAQLIEALEVAAFSGLHAGEVWAIDFTQVRHRGSPIGGMQSRPASGPVPLMGAIVKIVEMLIANPGMPKWEQAMRVDHELAATVAVGGARRAARMATKHWKDAEILSFATIKKDGGLWSSNNSIAIDDEFWAALDAKDPKAVELFGIVMQSQYNDGSGEPGLINISALDRDRVRDDTSFAALDPRTLIDRAQYPWSPETLPYLEAITAAAKRMSYRYIVNPCGEIPLSILGGVCIIGDLVPFHTDSFDEFLDAAAVMTRALIRVNLMRPGFRAEVERTNRIGVGLTGLHEYAAKEFGLNWHDLVCESEALLNPQLVDVLNADWPLEQVEQYLPAVKQLKSWDFWSALYRVRLHVTQTARAYSEELGLVTPRTALTIKPAGSTSKLAGLTEGVHLPAMARYLRWVQFQHGSTQIAEYEAQGYPVQHEIRNAKGTVTYPNVAIVGFPTKLPIADLLAEDELVTASEATVDDQFDWLRLLETYWLGDRYGAQVSYTLKWNRADVTYEDYVATMREQLPKVRCVSVMTSDDWKVTEGLYGYSPEQPLPREEFDALVAKISGAATEEIDMDMLRCASGACPI